MDMTTLDTILLFLYANRRYFDLQEIHQAIGLQKETDTLAAVEKLVREGYVTEEEQPIISHSRTMGVRERTAFAYFISFEGILLKESGGYMQKARNDFSTENRLKRVENVTFWLTVFVAIGAISQGVYCLVELYWKYGWFRF